MPSPNPPLDRICAAALHGVDSRIRTLGRTWQWMADRMEDRGLCSTGSVWQWKRGLSRQIGCGVYLAMLEELRAEETRQGVARGGDQ
jgi:hypothetical protein